MKKVRLGLIFTLLLGSGIVTAIALAQQVFNPFMSGQGYQQGVYSGFTPDVDSPNAILGVISNPPPQPEPTDIEGWMGLLSDPANYGLIPEFIKWLETEPARIDAFAKYILEHYDELGGLFNAIQNQVGGYSFAGGKYNLYLVRNNNNFLNLAITDKNNNLVLGTVFNKEGEIVSSVKVEGNTATVESQGKIYKLNLGKEIKYGQGGNLSFKEGEINIKLDENSSLVVNQEGNLVLKINGKEITLKSERQIVKNGYGSWTVTLSDGTQIVIDKEGKLMTINRPGVSFQLDISGLSQVNVGLERDKLTIKGYQTTQVCLEGESPCPANVFSLTLSSSGELSVDNGSAKVKVNQAEITLKRGMSLRFEEDGVIVTLKQENKEISYSINKDGKVSQVTINGINIPLPSGVKPSDIEINSDGTVKVTINGKTYIFTPKFGVNGPTVVITLPNGKELQLPSGAWIGNAGGVLVVFDSKGEEIAQIKFAENGNIVINGIEFNFGELGDFEVYLGIDKGGNVYIEAIKGTTRQKISIPAGTKKVNVAEKDSNLVITYIDPMTGKEISVVITGESMDVAKALEWLKSGDSVKIKIALEYLMKNFNSLTDEQKNKLAEILGGILEEILKNEELSKLIFGMNGWENFLKTLFEDGKIEDKHKLLIAERILGLVHQLLVSEAGKNLLKSILDFLIAKTPGPADAFNYYQNLLEQYLLVISQQVGGRDFLEKYIGDLAISAVGKPETSSEYKNLQKIIKTMLRLGFKNFLEEIANRLSKKEHDAGNLISKIMKASLPPGPSATYDDWRKWLEEHPEEIMDFLNWLKEHPDYIDDFLEWITKRWLNDKNDKLWDAFLNLLTGRNALAQKAVEILTKSDAGIKFLADLLEGPNSPLRNDKAKRENLAWALEGLIADLVNKAKGTNSEISRAAVALLLAMARYGNNNALEALKFLAKEENISAIQAIQYLITDNNRTDLLNFLIELASDPKLRDKVLEALGLLVNDKRVDQKIRAGAIRTLIEIAKRGADEATRIAAVNKLKDLGNWLFENRGDNWEALVEMIIKGLEEIANHPGQYGKVKNSANAAKEDLQKRISNQGKDPTPTPKPSTNNTTSNPHTNPSGTGPSLNLSGGPASGTERGSESRSNNNKPSQRNSPDSLSQYLHNNIFNHPSLRSPLQRLNKSKKASSKLKERFKNVNKKLGQKSKILAKGLREKLKKQGLSEEEIEAKVKEFLQKLADGEEEAKKYLEELGLNKEEIAKDFQDAEGFFSAEDQERYLKENFGIEAEEAKEIMNMTDEQAQIDFLKNEGFSESTAKLIVNPKLVEKELENFFKLVEELEDKLGLEDNPEAREKIADLLMEALLSEEITLDNFAELIEDPESFGEKVTRLELLLRELWKKIESRSLSAFSPFLN